MEVNLDYSMIEVPEPDNYNQKGFFSLDKWI
jgi:hypothetical protein